MVNKRLFIQAYYFDSFKTSVRMKLVGSQTIDKHDGKIISDKPENNAIRSAIAGKISVADSVGSNEWTMHIFFETDISSVDFVVPHAAIVGQSGRKGLLNLFDSNHRNVMAIVSANLVAKFNIFSRWKVNRVKSRQLQALRI